MKEKKVELVNSKASNHKTINEFKKNLEKKVIIKFGKKFEHKKNVPKSAKLI